jgi:hypothetical protein
MSSPLRRASTQLPPLPVDRLDIIHPSFSSILALRENICAV